MRDRLGMYRGLRQCWTECEARKVGEPCAAPKGEVLTFRWDECPVGATRDPHFQQALHLYNASRVAPLAGWPTGYVAWVVEAVGEIDTTVRDAAAKATNDGPPPAPPPGGPRHGGTRRTGNR